MPEVSFDLKALKNLLLECLEIILPSHTDFHRVIDDAQLPLTLMANTRRYVTQTTRKLEKEQEELSKSKHTHIMFHQGVHARRNAINPQIASLRDMQALCETLIKVVADSENLDRALADHLVLAKSDKEINVEYLARLSQENVRLGGAKPRAHRPLR